MLLNSSVLQNSILVEFDELVRLYSDHTLYGCALCVDRKLLTAYMVCSSLEVLENTEMKWSIQEWFLGADSEALKGGLNFFSDQMIEIHNESLLNQQNNSELNEDMNKYNIFLEGFKSAISEIKIKYENLNDLIFIMDVRGDKEVAAKTVKELNSLKNVDDVIGALN